MIKRFLIIFAMFFLGINSAFCASSNSALVKQGIAQYKAKNYAGCVYTMKDVIKNDPSNAMAHYYCAIAYARLGDKTEAINYYTKVVNLNSNATLTSYSKQGLDAINNGFAYNTQNAQADKFVQENYKNSINPDITKQLKLMELERTKEDINKRVHAPKITTPSAEEKAVTEDKDKEKDTKKETETKTEKQSYNSQPTDAEIAHAVRTLAAIGVNPLQIGGMNAQMAQYQQNPQTAEQYAASSQAAQDLAQLQMMFGSQNGNNSFGNNSMMNFLPYLMQNGNNNGTMSKEMLQTMMMTQMMPDFSFDTSKK